MKTIKEFGFGAIVYDEETRKFLLLKNKGENYWNFPKGGKLEGEIDAKTIARELKEETGIQKFELLPAFKETDEFEYPKTPEIFVKKKVDYYFAFVQGIEKIRLSDEHDDFAWIGEKEAMQKLTYEGSKRILKKAIQELEL